MTQWTPAQQEDVVVEKPQTETIETAKLPEQATRDPKSYAYDQVPVHGLQAVLDKYEGVTMEDVLAANPLIRDPQLMPVGTVVRIPL